MDADLGKAAEVLNQLLSDENAQEKVMSMLGGLLGGAPSDEDTRHEIIEAETTEDNEAPEMPVSAGGIDIQSIFESMGGGSDKRVRLLNAIRPYLNERRRPKLDGAITMVQMASISSGLGLDKMFGINRR